MKPIRFAASTQVQRQLDGSKPDAVNPHHAARGDAMRLTLPSALCRGLAAAGMTQRVLRILCACLVLLAVASVPRTAWADCWLSGGGAPTVNFNAGTINLSVGSQPSTTTPIWQSAVITPPGNTNISCNNTTVAGIDESIAGPPTGGDNTLFPTNVPGISYRLRHIAGSDQYMMASYPNQPLTARTNSALTGTTQMFLYYTGPYLPPSNATISGSLSKWETNICSNPSFTWWGGYSGCNGTVAEQPIEYFNISATITIQVPTCNVDSGSVSKTVNLPEVSAAQLATNQTPGKTPFSLQLINCPTGQKVFINLNTANAYTGGGATGVIAPTTDAGYAANVGVQILKADGSTPVTFTDDPAQAINTGTTTGTSYAIDLFARYYRTNTPVGAGSVKGIATYTINYQ